MPYSNKSAFVFEQIVTAEYEKSRNSVAFPGPVC